MTDPFEVAKRTPWQYARMSELNPAQRAARKAMRYAEDAVWDYQVGGMKNVLGHVSNPEPGPGEAFHGTSAAKARKVKRQGFKLADPRKRIIRKPDNGRTGSFAARTTRAGRRMVAPGAQGPGVYTTTNYHEAATYAREAQSAHGLKIPGTGGNFTPPMRLMNPLGSKRGKVLRVKIPDDKELKPVSIFQRHNRGTVQARKQGYKGVRGRPFGILGGDAHKVVSDPRDVEVLGYAKPKVESLKMDRVALAGGATAATTAGLAAAGKHDIDTARRRRMAEVSKQRGFPKVLKPLKAYARVTAENPNLKIVSGKVATSPKNPLPGGARAGKGTGGRRTSRPAGGAATPARDVGEGVRVVPGSTPTSPKNPMPAPPAPAVEAAAAPAGKTRRVKLPFAVRADGTTPTALEVAKPFAIAGGGLALGTGAVYGADRYTKRSTS